MIPLTTRKPRTLSRVLGRTLAVLSLFLVTAALAGQDPIEVSPEEGQQLVEEGRMELFDPADRAAANASRREERRIFRDYLRRHPEERATGLAMLRQHGPQTITIGAGRGVPRTVTLEGGDVGVGEVALSVVAARDQVNLLGIYEKLYDYAEPTGVTRDRSLPTPAESRTLAADVIKRNIATIVAERITILQRLPQPPDSADQYPFIGPFAQPVDCVGGFPADVGNGYGGDQDENGNQSCDLSWEGILANDARPYRNHLSCVRNQASRGTCAAFAAVSALEMGYSMTRDQKINLSEQMVYFRRKIKAPMDLDGMSLIKGLQDFAQHGITIPFELAWNYNPSFDREYAGGGLFRWKYSCNSYDEACSDTTPQGTYTCFRPAPGQPRLCGLVAPPNVGGVRLIDGPLSVWDPEDKNASIDTVKTLLDAGIQITLNISINETFLAADDNGGYVSYDGGVQVLNGIHSVHLVSYIENADLAEILPNAPPGEAGPLAPESDKGGYFIVRNSWGTCWADGGYAYIPYRWLRPPLFVRGAHAHDPANIVDAP